MQTNASTGLERIMHLVVALVLALCDRSHQTSTQRPTNSPSPLTPAPAFAISASGSIIGSAGSSKGLSAEPKKVLDEAPAASTVSPAVSACKARS
eukprot:1194816-Prorocentrum_minimum.AAC.4